ncbi:MAG TPA: type II toxin-antitoxin system death-on-curing family toxin [bacterium]|nr:type II toxin-antitoxin system death-on-curing family toxin [bacterium]HPN45750.1 type II toxin-antitoxin system death-on-curing family toxin [bacterium]
MKRYLTVQEILFIHQKLFDEFGGSPGIRDIDNLESAVMRPQSGYYNDIYEEAAALMESLAMNHPFLDGNKRIAFFATDTFLRINGYFISCDNEEAFKFFINLFNTGHFNYPTLVKWLREHVESLKG